MKIHHLSCGSFCPHIPHLPFGSKQSDVRLACHCLLIETAQGLVLVDSGFGVQDVLNPMSRLGLAPFVLKVDLLKEQTAYYQISQLGFQPQDVRHIVVTHMDSDHIGGLSDFPWATVHVFEEELTKVTGLMTTNFRWRHRIRKKQFSHPVKWQTYKSVGESWMGLEAVKDLKGLPPEILLIPLRGHTPGHCGVAVQGSESWLLHAGDSYFQEVEITSDYQKTPLWLQLYEAASAFDDKARTDNLKKLRALKEDPQLNIFCAHDDLEYHRCQR